jgi:hypothetical protein
MRVARGPLGLLALTAALLALVFGAQPAQADTGDIIEAQHDPPTAADGFQAGTCTTDLTWPNQCSPITPEIFFKQAAGHPPIGFTQYAVKLFEPEAGKQIPVGSVGTIRVDLPAGLTVNPEATIDGEGNPIRCTMEQFKAAVGPFEVGCPPETQVGEEEVTLKVVAGPGLGTTVPPTLGVTKVPLFNLVPEFGEPARFGFKIGAPGSKKEVFLEGDVAWDSDYHQGFTIKIPTPSPGTLTWKSRLVNFGRTGDGTYITTPTTCFDPDTGAYSTFLRARPAAEEAPQFPAGFTPFAAGLPPGVELEGCEIVPFDPSLAVLPGTDLVDSPAAPQVTVEMPFEPDPEGLERSHVRNASITLPAGMGLNPSAAPGLAACTDAQFGKGTRNPVSCPAASLIGTAEVETQPLPAGSLKGNVYLGQQLGTNPESGNMYRIFINPVTARYGVDVRLIGNIIADKETGQLTTVLAENPQVPFESVTLKLDPAKGLLTSPPTCGPNVTTSAMEPWARPGTTANPSSSFGLTKAPGGGPCPTTLAGRPFGPAYNAGPAGNKAGAFSPFRVNLLRADGEQEVKRIDVKLPPGMVAKLAGVEYCPEASIDAAGAKTGAAELASPSCPGNSLVGTTTIDTGSGAVPLSTAGKVYLAGRYKGAPVSMVFVTPALAGPFDLGTVVVRAALQVDPETAEVKAVSDPIPDVFGGAKLDIRGIDVFVNRPNFTLNPTTCRAGLEIRSTIFGGGADPANPAAWQSVARNNGFRAKECRALGFKPKFHARIFGGKNQTQRAKNPKFRAIFDAREGDANLRRAAFILPRATILDQSHIRTICTRVQLASNTCPKDSIYGNARARSPLLDGVLKGPVYLTSSDHELPDLLVDLKGQVDIRLRGVISGKNARLKTVFNNTPDVAVDKFILTMKGGDRGLLINSRNLCERQTTGFLNLKAQNSRRLKKKNLRLNIPACRGGKNG